MCEAWDILNFFISWKLAKKSSAFFVKLWPSNNITMMTQLAEIHLRVASSDLLTLIVDISQTAILCFFSESGWKTFITLPKFQFLSLGERLYFSQTVLVIDWLNFSPHLFFLFFSSSSSFSIARISKKMLLTSYSFQHHKVHLNNWHESKKDYIDLVFLHSFTIFLSMAYNNSKGDWLNHMKNQRKWKQIKTKREEAYQGSAGDFRSVYHHSKAALAH